MNYTVHLAYTSKHRISKETKSIIFKQIEHTGFNTGSNKRTRPLSWKLRATCPASSAHREVRLIPESFLAHLLEPNRAQSFPKIPHRLSW